MKKSLLSLLLIMFFTILIGCTPSAPINKQIKFATFGGTEILPIEANTDGYATIPSAPNRDDNAAFIGWYTNLSFNEEFDFSKTKITKDITLYAQWDRLYFFTLVYGREAFCGVKKDGYIGFYIPKGTYEIEFLSESSAQVGNIYICDSAKYSLNEGYDIISNTLFAKGNKKTLTVDEDRHIEITINSIFSFKNTAVAEKYISPIVTNSATSESNNNSHENNPALIIALVVFIVMILLMTIMFVIINKIKVDEKSKKIIAFIKTKDNCSLEELCEATGLDMKEAKNRLGIICQLVPSKELKNYKIERGVNRQIDQIRKVTGSEVSNAHNSFANLLLSSSEFNENYLKNNGFYISKIIPFEFSAFNRKKYGALYIDDINKKWATGHINRDIKIYNFRDLNGFELFENGDSKVKGTAGKTLIGGMFFGLGGALVGSAMSKNVNTMCNIMKVHIRINNLQKPEEVITFINNINIRKDSAEYKETLARAKDFCANLDYILNNNEAISNPSVKSNLPLLKVEKDIKEKLLELAELRKDALITEEEYNYKRNKILEDL